MVERGGQPWPGRRLRAGEPAHLCVPAVPVLALLVNDVEAAQVVDPARARLRRRTRGRGTSATPACDRTRDTGAQGCGKSVHLATAESPARARRTEGASPVSAPLQ